MTIAETYATYCSELNYSDIPDSVIEYSKVLLQDHIGLTIGGATYSPSAQSFIQGVRELEGHEDGRGNATVLSTGDRLTPGYACMLNAALGHSLDYDDTVLGGHVGTVVIPAALSVGEEHHGTGKDLIRGIVAGYEVMTRILLAINRPIHYNRGFHPTATCGVFGATAAAGVLAGLQPTEFENAFGLNASQVAGTNGYSIHGGWNKRVHPGLATHSAIIAVKMAESGFKGIQRPLEGERNVFDAYTENPDVRAATDSLGTNYNLLKTGIKPYPCGRRIHTAMDIAIDLTRAHDIQPRTIESITIDVSSQNVQDLATPLEDKTHPESFVDAQFSLQFGVGLGIVKQEAGIQSFIDEVTGGYRDDIQYVMDRTTIHPNDSIFDDEYTDYHARVTIETDDQSVTDARTRPRGEPEKPLEQKEIEEKFRQLTADLTEEKQRESIEIIRNIERYDIVELTEIFR